MSSFIAVLPFALIPFGASAQSGGPGFTAINVSGAGTGAGQGTAVTAIDAAGDVTGIYRTSSGGTDAFVLPSGGAITTFNAAAGADATIPIGFDTAGDIVGIYEDSSNRIHGFLRLASTGAITALDVAGEDTGKMEGTFPVCINGSGEIAGDYSTTMTTSSGTNSFAHGFIRSAGGTYTTFDAEPIPTSYGSTNPGTFVVSINASGEVAGFYIDGIGAEHGFLRNAAGTISTFEAPNAGTAAEQGTIVTGIDASGDVIGVYVDTSNAIHGFLRNASTGAFTTIDAPGAGTATYQGTYPDAFDAAGDVFGSFTDANNVVHGFVLPVNGTIATYDAPGSSAADAIHRAASAKLNAKLRQLARGYGFSSKPRKSNSPLMKMKSLLSRVGAVSPDGTGLLNGNGPNPSGTASPGNLILNGVNASGEAVGIYSDGDYVFHSYLRAANGTITTINDSSAGTAAEQGTGAFAINASGVIAGTYEDSNSVLHGFLYDSSTLTATTTTLTPAPTPNPSVYQEPVTLTASVTSSDGTPANGETVTFMSGASSLGTAELTSGTASLTTTDIPAGTDSITAVYGGDSSFAGSTSAAVSQTVNKASSSTTLKSSLNPSTSGQSVTFTANISGQFSGVATGTVTFSNGGSSLGSAAVSSNAATFATTTLPVGTDSITAVYSGDSNFTTSTSGALSQVVNAAAAQTATPTFSPIAGTYTSAQNVTISDSTSGSTIYYTTNGTTPTTSSTQYVNPISVGASETIEAIAAASGYTNSAVASATYTINIPVVATPTFSPAAGTYTSAQTVTISDSTSGSTIYYTTNGTTPTTGSIAYTTPIAVSSSETIEAIAVASGDTNSAVATAAYTINIVEGFGPPSGYTPSSISIEPGATTGNTATISIVGTNGFSGTVSLSCTITPVAANDAPTCSLSPSSVTLSGTTAQTSTLTVLSTGSSSSVIRPLWRPVGGTALAVILLFTIPRRRRNWLAMLLLLAIVAGGSMMGCGGSSNKNNGTTAGSYSVTVTGTSGATSATIATVPLTIE